MSRIKDLIRTSRVTDDSPTVGEIEAGGIGINMSTGGKIYTSSDAGVSSEIKIDASGIDITNSGLHSSGKDVQELVEDMYQKISRKVVLTDGKLDEEKCPLEFKDVLSLNSFSSFPLADKSGPSIPIEGTLYIDSSSGRNYLYDGESKYHEVSSRGMPVPGSVSGDKGKIEHDHAIQTGNAHGITLSDLCDSLSPGIEKKIFSSDIEEGNRFGSSVAINGNRCIVGAYSDDDNGLNSGSAYIFDVSTGEQLFKLLPSDGAENDIFGSSVAINGNRCIVGAYGNDDNGSSSGSSYIFDVTTGQQLFKLLPSNGAENDFFGRSVSISGDRCIAGADGDDDNVSNSGSAYIFDVNTGYQLNKLVASDGAENDFFGYSVAISGDRCIVGAYGDDDNGSDSGSAYIFDVSTGQQLFKLLPSDGAENDYFGYSVSISGNRCIVGSKDDDNGSNSGSAYIFDVNTGQQLFKLLPGDGADYDYFGRSVSISGNRCIVGAHGDDDNGSDSGSAYIFDVNTGQQLYKLLPSDGADSDYFGYSVSISGDRCIVGAHGDDDNGSDSGSSYIINTSAIDLKKSLGY